MKYKDIPVKTSKQKIDKLSLTFAHLICSIIIICPQAFAQEPVTAIKKYEIPAGPLDNALNQFARSSGVMLSFPPATTQGKETKGLKGSFTTKEGFKELLKGTGLEVVDDQHGGYFLDKAPPSAPLKTETLNLQEVKVRAKKFHEIGPLPGLGLTKEQIPGNVQSITAKEIKESHSLSLTDLLNKKLQSVNVNDYQGNPFQMDVQYRGFTAGPQIGTPQGLSVFFDGIRVNEPFGDVVNWDMIPMNAIAGVDVFPGSNPIFGLNTLGGAFTLKTKDGFNHEGIDAEVLAGSFGRKQLQVEGGWNNGDFALFGAGNFFLEDGWRDNSPSKVNQFFGKASYRGEKLDLNLSTLLVSTDLVGNGLLPSEEYARDPTSVFTSPDTTKNKLQQFQLSSSYFVNDNFTITGQVYRRNSDRHQKGGDVFTDYEEDRAAKSRPPEGDDYTCLLRSTNQYGIPDYLVIPINTSAGEIFDNSDILNDWVNNNGIVDLAVKYAPFKNTPLPQIFVDNFKINFNYSKNYAVAFYDRSPEFSSAIDEKIEYYPGLGLGLQAAYAIGLNTFSATGADMGTVSSFINQNVMLTNAGDAFFPEFRNNGAGGQDLYKNYVIFLAPENQATCRDDFNKTRDFPGPYNIVNPDGDLVVIDGIGFNQPGYAEGTPTGVITDNKINQIVNGASIQFNWNLEKHKFMVGASIDSASAEYANTQQLGFVDANRIVYLDPTQANPQFGGAYVPLANNDFEGTNVTKSIYFSETWTPVETLNLNFSGRYNQTQTKNKVATRYGFGVFNVGDVRSSPDEFDTCTTDAECEEIGNQPATNLEAVLDPAETEKFSYYSFNPSLGVTWQAKENLNLFANIAKGTRTPSVIELGCAFDKTPVMIAAEGDRNGDGIVDPALFEPKSLQENRSCSLPTALSGDPYLPQIKATSYDIGMRGNIAGLLGTDGLEWNIGAYQTDLKDDIYFVTLGNAQGFFDTIGKTRRRGIEAGLSGRKDKWGFGINYALTDATFEDNFRMINVDNSSSTDIGDGFGQTIKVKQGSRMPGVSLHNLNANVSYEVTPEWTVGFTAVAHSESFVRGNENNEHKQGVRRQRNFGNNSILLPPTNNPGKVPGYATFNFQTSYKFNSEWTATMLVNNVFDKEYFSAGRLGRNPFSPSINGAIGVSGYNHNSGDWLSTNFIAPGAPRAAWFSLNWQFDPRKNNLASGASMPTEPSRVGNELESAVEKPYQPLPPPTHRYQGAPKVED